MTQFFLNKDLSVNACKTECGLITGTNENSDEITFRVFIYLFTIQMPTEQIKIGLKTRIQPE
jgi:hypothetical protein